jgi:hypothetical protein
MALKNSAPNSQKTHCLFSTKTNWLMLFKEVGMFVSYESLVKHHLQT